MYKIWRCIWNVYNLFYLQKIFCVKCYGSHKHNNVESNYEHVYNIIKDKNDALYKPVPICDWNTSFEVDYAIAMERMISLHSIDRIQIWKNDLIIYLLKWYWIKYSV